MNKAVCEDKNRNLQIILCGFNGHSLNQNNFKIKH